MTSDDDVTSDKREDGTTTTFIAISCWRAASHAACLSPRARNASAAFCLSATEGGRGDHGAGYSPGGVVARHVVVVTSSRRRPDVVARHDVLTYARHPHVIARHQDSIKK